MQLYSLERSNQRTVFLRVEQSNKRMHFSAIVHKGSDVRRRGRAGGGAGEGTAAGVDSELARPTKFSAAAASIEALSPQSGKAAPKFTQLYSLERSNRNNNLLFWQ